FPTGQSSEYVAVWIDAPSGQSSDHFQPTTAVPEIPVFGYGKFGIGGYATSGPDRGKTFERYETFEVSAEKPTVQLDVRFAEAGEEIEVLNQSGRPALPLRIGRLKQAEPPPIVAGPAPRNPFKTTDVK